MTCIQPTIFHTTSLRYTLILSFHVLLSIARDIFIFGFPTKILHAFLAFLMLGAGKRRILAHVLCPEHLALKLRSQRHIRRPKEIKTDGE
jgi:hypothetical protein